MVLEARERLGGRTKTVKVGKGNFDVGAQWIGPLQKRITTLVAELGIETFPTYDSGKKILDLFGKLSYYSGLIPIVASHFLACLAFHGASSGTFLAIASMRQMANCAIIKL